LRLLTRIGLAARLNGTGVVASQIPAAGSSIEPGGTCELWLERAPTAASLGPGSGR
jgi:beta-lactam-binding protein with PASTA domain